MPMKLMSVGVPQPIEVPHGRRLIKTGIFKNPVTCPIRVKRYNLEGVAKRI